MQRRTIKQKCLAWLLSLAVAVTFIPLTAGVAFADDPTPMYINLEKANTGQAGGNEVKVYVNFEAPWQDGEDLSEKNTTAVLVPGQVYTGDEMKPVVKNVACKMGAGRYTLDSKDSSGQSYFTVDYGNTDWKTTGSHVLKVVANPDAAPVTFTNNETTYSAKFTGTYTFNCTIAPDTDLSNSKVTFGEGTVNKNGEIEVPYDGKLHQLKPVKVEDHQGNVIPEGSYSLKYPNESTNAYRKVGKFDIVISAVEGNEGGYTGSITKVVSITDVVTDITVYSQKGLNGKKEQRMVFKYAKWNNYSLSKPLDWGYGGKNGETVENTESYIPIETLLSEAGLGEIGKFNSKDLIDLWTNSDPEHYFNAPKTIAELQKFIYVVKTENKVLDTFAGEYSIPAFLVIDCSNASMNPRGAVGSDTANGLPQGNMSPSAVSEVVLVSMNIAGLSAKASNVTYTGSAVVPKVTVNDGKDAVPVTVKATAKNVGPATATVTAKADSAYYGTKNVKYNVLPKGTTLKSLKKGKKKFTVKWAKQKTQTTGYQIRYSKKSDFSGAKTKLIKKNGTTKTTIKKLAKKTTYYVQVRTYKTVSGTKYYSAWSATKTVKTR